MSFSDFFVFLMIVGLYILPFISAFKKAYRAMEAFDRSSALKILSALWWPIAVLGFWDVVILLSDVLSPDVAELLEENDWVGIPSYAYFFTFMASSATVFAAIKLANFKDLVAHNARVDAEFEFAKSKPFPSD